MAATIGTLSQKRVDLGVMPRTQEPSRALVHIYASLTAHYRLAKAMLKSLMYELATLCGRRSILEDET